MTSIRTEFPSSGSALVALLPDHVLFAFAHAAEFLANVADRPGRIAITRQRIVIVDADVADELGTIRTYLVFVDVQLGVFASMIAEFFHQILGIVAL